MKTKKNIQPLVSVIMPVYNAGDFLVEAIESILNQTYKNFEFIIVDDGSTDNSWKIIKKYSKKDNRIKAYKNKKNLGIALTINKALSKTKGNFVARMDADDIALPTRLEKQVKFLMENKNIGLVGSQMLEINEKNIITNLRKVPLTDENIKKNLFITQTIQNPTLMINKKALPAEILHYNPTLSPVDDLDMFFRLASFTKFANLPDYLMIYRKHNNNSSLKNIKKTFLLTLKVRAKALIDYGYKTNLINLFITFIQSIIIFTLPDYLIYKIFKLFKGYLLNDKKIELKRFLREKTYRNRKIELSLVVPVYKAEDFIKKNIEMLNRFLREQKIKYEIITVVDGNLDKSFDILSKISRKNHNLKIFKLNDHRGKGAAVRFGLEKAKYSYIGYIDAGFDIHYSSLETIINNVKNYKNLKVFIADKTHPMSITENIPYIRKFYSYVFNRLANLFVKTGKIDTQVGLKIFKKDVIKNVIKKLPLKINGFAFDIEIIKELMKRKYQICKVPVTIVKEKRSSVTLKGILLTFVDLLKLSYFYQVKKLKVRTVRKSEERNFIKYFLRPVTTMFL